MNALPEFADRGVRAAVILHDREMRAFLPVWREAIARGVPLPKTDDRAYQGYGALGRHVLGAAWGYVTWICRSLELPEPGIRKYPDAEAVLHEAEAYMEHLLEGWPHALVAVPTDKMETVFESNWGTPYSIDAMLEHAVMHPVRHRLQLEELMARGAHG